MRRSRIRSAAAMLPVLGLLSALTLARTEETAAQNGNNGGNKGGTVQATASLPLQYRILDNGDPDFTFGGTWNQSVATGTGFNDDFHWADPGSGSLYAYYRFANLPPGQYRVYVGFIGYSWAASNTPFTVWDDNTLLTTTPIRVNQSVTPTDLTDAAFGWKDLGTFSIASSTLWVGLTNDANNFVNADAVRIERVGFPGRIIDDSNAGFTASPAGSWFNYPGIDYGLQGDLTYANAGSGSATASYNFTGLTAGDYRVSISFVGYPWAPTNTPWTVNGSGPIPVNQQATPTDFQDAGAGWKDLGVFTITGTTLTVSVSNNVPAGTYPNADAVRVERVNGGVTGPTVADTVRFLEQATWGPNPALINQVRATGFDAWLNGQINQDVAVWGPWRFPVSSPQNPIYISPIGQTEPFAFRNMNNTNTAALAQGGRGPDVPNVTGDPTTWDEDRRQRDWYTDFSTKQWFYLRALYGPDQLRLRAMFALHQFLVVSTTPEITRSIWYHPYLNILEDNAFGNYRDILFQITLNPAMGNYLDMRNSVAAAPNENYGREILQLFSVGEFRLNADGTPFLVGGNPTPAYTEADVQALAKVFTGWRFRPRDPARDAPNATNYTDPMWLQTVDNPTYVAPDFSSPTLGGGQNANNHDWTQKVLFADPNDGAATTTIPAQATAGRTVANGYVELNQALDAIYNHPNVGPFVCKQLIQHLVTSNPSPAYVGRVTAVFNSNKTASNQLALVVRAILLDPEARGDSKTAAEYGKLRGPHQNVLNLLRLFDAQSADRSTSSDANINGFVNTQGMSVFSPGSVFSYFPPDKPLPGGPEPLVGPEFGVLTTTTALARANFANTLSVPNTTSTNPIVVLAAASNPNNSRHDSPYGTSIDLTPYRDLLNAQGVTALVDKLNELMMHNTMSPEMRQSVIDAVNAVPSSAFQANKRVRTAVYLIASSSQYHVQR